MHKTMQIRSRASVNVYIRIGGNVITVILSITEIRITLFHQAHLQIQRFCLGTRCRHRGTTPYPLRGPSIDLISNTAN